MVKKLKLVDFRNFKAKTLEFSDKITTIVGPNASGKTNVLEALYLLSTGKSFKARTESEMLRDEQELARVFAICSMPNALRSENHSEVVNHKTESIEHNTRLEVVVTEGLNGWPRKKLQVNGVPKRLIDFAGNFRTVLFGPWDMDIVTGSPSLRRRFLDTVLSQVDREYRRNVLSYEKGLRQRNRLLYRIREEGLSRSQLLFWNQLLIKNGDYVSQKRQEFIEYVNAHPGLNDQAFNLEYDKSPISVGRLEQYKEEEVAAGTTLVGPHRDDFVFKQDKRELSSFGSRGEQRMAVLWLKIAELNFIEEKTLERPTLLLDDIFSELDHEHRDVVVQLAKNQQTIITTADPHFVKSLKKVERIELLG